MQISRHLLMTCAVAAFLTPTLAPAADNEAQIRARQALEEKMRQMDAQTPSTTSVPPAMAKPEPAAPAPAVSARSTDKATSDKLSEALHQKMRETEPEPVAMPAPPQPPEKPKKKPAPPVVVKAPPAEPNYNTAPAPTFAPIPTTSNTVRATLPEQPTPTAASTPTYAPIPDSSNAVHPALPEVSLPEPAPAVSEKQMAPPMVSLPVLVGPPSSFSAAKQQKLDALLQQYRMDQLTPQQYHEQRAKILSEP